MLPVVKGLAGIMGIEPELSTLAPGRSNLRQPDPIGASANIAALGILKKDGYQVKAGEFMKIYPLYPGGCDNGLHPDWLIWDSTGRRNTIPRKFLVVWL